MYHHKFVYALMWYQARVPSQILVQEYKYPGTIQYYVLHVVLKKIKL